jgi:hypothetical protein
MESWLLIARLAASHFLVSDLPSDRLSGGERMSKVERDAITMAAMLTAPQKQASEKLGAALTNEIADDRARTISIGGEPHLRNDAVTRLGSAEATSIVTSVVTVPRLEFFSPPTLEATRVNLSFIFRPTTR